MTNQMIVFPEPAENVDGNEGSIGEELERLTFAIYPQERTSRLPFAKHTTFKEPLGRFPMVKIAGDVLIC